MVVRKQSRQGSELNLRHVWLASLGAVVVGRREMRAAADKAVDRAGRLGGLVYGIAIDARDVARGGLLTLREQLEPKLGSLGAEVQVRLAPVLGRLAGTPKAARPVRKGRKPAAKPAGRRASGRRITKTTAGKARG